MGTVTASDGSCLVAGTTSEPDLVGGGQRGKVSSGPGPVSGEHPEGPDREHTGDEHQ